MAETMDQEPTLAADLTADPETLNIHAWSQADDAEAVTTFIPRRSWKIPAAALAVATTAALGAATFLMWPEDAENPQVAPTNPQVTAGPVAPTIQASPPVQPQSPDQRFLALLPQRGVRVVSPPLQLSAGHNVCTLLAQGYLGPEIAQAYVNSTPGTDLKTESIMVDTAEEVYCPTAAAS